MLVWKAADLRHLTYVGICHVFALAVDELRAPVSLLVLWNLYRCRSEYGLLHQLSVFYPADPVSSSLSMIAIY